MDDVKNLLIALNEVALHLLGGMKDGMLKDFEELWAAFQNDADFKAKLLAAYAGLQKVPAELQGLGVLDGLALVETEVAYLPKLLEVIKAQAPAPAPAA
jgi:hypothetical protein